MIETSTTLLSMFADAASVMPYLGYAISLALSVWAVRTFIPFGLRLVRGGGKKRR